MTLKTLITGSVLAAVAATGIAGSASAHDRAARDERRAAMFAELDANGDGALSVEELSARADAKFAELDKDGNGVLSAEELAAIGKKRAEKRAERMIKRLDADNDGVLSQTEIQAKRDPAKLFERLDANDDGSVSAEEFADAKGPFAGRHGHGGKGWKRHHREGDN